MTNNRKKIGLLIILLGVIIIILIIYFGFIKSKPLPTTETPEITPSGQLPSGPVSASTTPSDSPRNYQKYDISQEAPHQTNANDLAKIGMAFAARFGSYSNQSDYGNFTDLKIFMTDNMKEWVDTYITQLKKQASAGGYYGLTTRAISAEVKSFDDQAGTALIVILTERSESGDKISGGTPQPQKIDLTFKKVNGDWLVDRAYWEK